MYTPVLPSIKRQLYHFHTKKKKHFINLNQRIPENGDKKKEMMKPQNSNSGQEICG